MSIFSTIPKWTWTAFAAIGTVTGTVLGVINFWMAIQKLVITSTTEAIVKITSDVHNTESALGNFLIDDLRDRIIATEDEIIIIQVRQNEVIKHNKNNDPSAEDMEVPIVPPHLIRQKRMMEDRLTEAKLKWEK